MGRKEQKIARDQSQDMYKFQMDTTKEQQGVQREGRAALMPRATNLADNTGYSQELKSRLEGITRDEGYSPQEESAITQDTTGAVSSAYGKAREGMGRMVARTGNSAGYGGANAELAREEAKSLGESTRTNKLNFANERRSRRLQNYGLTQGVEDEQQRRQEQGTNMLARIYGIDTGAFTSGRNAAMDPLQNYTGLANQKGFGSKFQDFALDTAGTILTGGKKRTA
jgi:hypothetical protein